MTMTKEQAMQKLLEKFELFGYFKTAWLESKEENYAESSYYYEKKGKSLIELYELCNYEDEIKNAFKKGSDKYYEEFNNQKN